VKLPCNRGVPSLQPVVFVCWRKSASVGWTRRCRWAPTSRVSSATAVDATRAGRATRRCAATRRPPGSCATSASTSTVTTTGTARTPLPPPPLATAARHCRLDDTTISPSSDHTTTSTPKWLLAYRQQVSSATAAVENLDNAVPMDPMNSISVRECTSTLQT